MKTPSNLPPGVTDNDIENQAGGDPERVKCARCGRPIAPEDVQKIYFKNYHPDCADEVLSDFG